MISTASNAPAPELDHNILNEAIKLVQGQPSPIKQIYFKKEYLEKLLTVTAMKTTELEQGAASFMGIPFHESPMLPVGVDAVLVNAKGDLVLLTNEKYPHKKAAQK